MKTPDQNPAVEIPEPELPMPLERKNGAALIREQAAPQTSHERQGQEEFVTQLRLLWARRRFLARVTAIGLVLSTAVAFLIPKHYPSLARLMPPDNQSSSGLAMAAAALSASGAAVGGLGGLAGDLLGMKSTSDLLVGVLGSHTVQDNVIERCDLRKVYGIRHIEDARKALEARTDISVDRKSQIITIKVTDKDPQRAAAIVSAYIDELNRTVATVSTSSARRERIFLERRLQSVSRDLENAEIDFSHFASKNDAIDIKEQGKAMIEAAAKLQSEVGVARSQLQGLRQLYADNNVRVRSVRARIAELENELSKFDGQAEDASDAAASSGELYPSIRRLPVLGVTYADLYRSTMIQEAIFETLTKQYELAKVQEAKEIPTVKVLDVPTIPERKSFPPRLLLMMLGTALAFSWGAAWVFGHARWEQTDASDPRKALAQEVLSTVKAAIPWAARNGQERRFS